MGNGFNAFPFSTCRYVGGLTAREGKPLPSDLDKWLSESDCVTLVSFGTRFTSMSREDAAKLLEAFAVIRCRILFRIRNMSRDLQVPQNVIIRNWIPQNDALAHRNMRLFVSHSGNNGQFEALYHGVPMLAFYFDGDQLHNARRMELNSFGKRLAWHGFRSSDLADAIRELLENSTYATSIKRASAVFRSYKHPAVRSADAIESLVKFGDTFIGEYKQEAQKLTIFELYLIDIAFFAFSLTTVLVLLLCKALRQWCEAIRLVFVSFS